MTRLHVKIPRNTSKSFRFFRIFIQAVFVRPVVILLSGCIIDHRERFPKNGPAIVVANHNSHADTILIMSVFQLKVAPQVRPAGAADYFFSNRFISWISSRFLGIIPVLRSTNNNSDLKKNNEKQDVSIDDSLKYVFEALDANEVVVMYPEGTRSTTGHIAKIKRGIAYIAEKYPDVPIIPVHLDGTTRVLPKGTFLPVPFLVRMSVGQKFTFKTEHDVVENLQQYFDEHDKKLDDDVYY